MARSPALRRTSTLESAPFLVLSENQLAYAAVSNLTQPHTSRACPVVTVYGQPGCGKSHLAHHLIAQFMRQHRQAGATHITAAEFAAEWSEAVKSRTIAAFEEMYGALDLLVCEDLQDLRNRSGAQEALVSQIDEFASRGARVLLTCSGPPGELAGLSPRLTNRCHGGVCIRIDVPGRPGRLKLLRHFASQQQVPVPLDVLEYLAAHGPSTPRELRGTMTQLLQLAQQRRRAVDLPLAQSLLGDDPAKGTRPVSEIAREVARQFGVTLRVLRSESRTASAVVPRQAAMYLSRELTDSPYAEIGAYFAGRSHSTVSHACQRFEELLETDPKLHALAETIRRRLARPGVSRRQPVDGARRRRAAGA